MSGKLLLILLQETVEDNSFGEKLIKFCDFTTPNLVLQILSLITNWDLVDNREIKILIEPYS